MDSKKKKKTKQKKKTTPKTKQNNISREVIREMARKGKGAAGEEEVCKEKRQHRAGRGLDECHGCWVAHDGGCWCSACYGSWHRLQIN